MTDYPLIGVVRVREGQGGKATPPYNRAWSKLKRLRWWAELTEHDAGAKPGTIEVHPGQKWTNGVFQQGTFSLSMPGCGVGPGDYESTRMLISGIGLGIGLARYDIRVGAEDE